MSYMRDPYGVRLDALAAIPNCFGWWDASQTTGTNGSGVHVIPDRSGSNNDMIQPTAASRPTLNVAAQNGLNTVTFANLLHLFTMGTTWKQGTSRAQPLTYVALIKATTQGSANRLVITTSGGTFTGFGITGSSGGLDPWPYPFAGSAGVGGGKGITDGQWHVVVATLGTVSSAMFVDGYLVASTSTQSQGSNTASGAIFLGSSGSGAGFVGDMAEAMAFQTDMSIAQVQAVTEHLNTKWGLGLTVPQQNSVTWANITDAGGQSVRVFVPDDIDLSASNPLVVLNHHQGGTNAVVPGIAWYGVVHSLVNAGYIVAIPTNHGTDSWTNASASADGAAALAWVEANLCTVSRVVLLGHSMGAALSAMQAKDTQYGAKLKGIYLVDGAVNLRVMYNLLTSSMNTGFSLVTGTTSASISGGATSFSSSVSYAAGTQILVDRAGTNPEIVTVAPAGPSGSGPYTIPITGSFGFAHSSGVPVSDYPTKTAGRDPNLFTVGQLPTGLRWRFMSSSADTNVPKTTNTDLFKTLVDSIASPLESVSLTHSGGHLETGAHWPSDMVAFADRSV